MSEMELEVMAAEREVEEARTRLVAELEAVSEEGREALARVVHRARPLALAAAAIAGVAVLAGTVALVRSSVSRTRTRTPSYLMAPKQRSLFSEMFRQALTSAAGTFAAAIARSTLASLEQPETQRAESAGNGHTPPKKRANADEAKTARR